MPMTPVACERRRIALELLKLMLANGGDKRDKVRAAVEYTDLLLEELARG